MNKNRFTQIQLKELITQLGETEVQKIISSFQCPQNDDIEHFIRKLAIPFTKSQIAQTYLVFFCEDSLPNLVGYYSLAVKTLNLEGMQLSQTLRKKVSKFATYNSELDTYSVPAPLVAQLGKNFYNRYNKLITGEELLEMACEKVMLAQEILGGKIVYLECEDKEKLVSFYKDNGFVVFGERIQQNGKKLIQLMKYM